MQAFCTQCGYSQEAPSTLSALSALCPHCRKRLLVRETTADNDETTAEASARLVSEPAAKLSDPTEFEPPPPSVTPRCPHCGAPRALGPQEAGKSRQCPSCGRSLFPEAAAPSPDGVVVFHCPACSYTRNVPLRFKGVKARCTRCGVATRIGEHNDPEPALPRPVMQLKPAAGAPAQPEKAAIGQAPAKNRRRAERVPALKIYVSPNQTTTEFDVRDLSLSGFAFFHQGWRFEVGQNITFDLIDDYRTALTEGKAVVARQDADIVGCAFTSLTSEQALALARLIEGRKSAVAPARSSQGH